MTKKEVYQLFKAYYVNDVNWTDVEEDGISHTLHVIFGTMPFTIHFKNEILNGIAIDMAYINIDGITFSSKKLLIGRLNGVDIIRIRS